MGWLQCVHCTFQLLLHSHCYPLNFFFFFAACLNIACTHNVCLKFCHLSYSGWNKLVTGVDHKVWNTNSENAGSWRERLNTRANLDAESGLELQNDRSGWSRLEKPSILPRTITGCDIVSTESGFRKDLRTHGGTISSINCAFMSPQWLQVQTSLLLWPTTVDVAMLQLYPMVSIAKDCEQGTRRGTETSNLLFFDLVSDLFLLKGNH